MKLLSQFQVNLSNLNDASCCSEHLFTRSELHGFIPGFAISHGGLTCGSSIYGTCFSVRARA